MPNIIPYRGKNGYIFISYAHRDAATVLPILERMGQDGYRFWFDEGIDPGTEWDEFIAEHIISCEYFIAFMSKNYLASSNCKDELNYARDLEKKRLIVYLEDVVLPAGLAMRINRLQSVFYHKYPDADSFFRMLYVADGLDAFCSDEDRQAVKTTSTTNSIKTENTVPPVKTDNTASTASSNTIPITNVSVYNSDGAPEGALIRNGTAFFRNEAKYIGFKLHFASKPYARNVTLHWRIEKENGEYFSQQYDQEIELKADWVTYSKSWGWKSAGNWPFGKYKIVASFNEDTPTETWFEIKPGSYDTMPVPIKSVKMFNSTGGKLPPSSERTYTTVFDSKTACYLYFQLYFDQPGKDLNVTINYHITNSEGKNVAHMASPILVAYNYVSCWTGWGWKDPGHWKPGRYYYTISMGDSNTLTGSFDVR